MCSTAGESSPTLGADPGGPGGPCLLLYFWQSRFYVLHCIQCLKKIFLKLNLDFIVAKIRGVFGSVGVYVCVCVNRNRGRYCFLFCKCPILNDIRGHSDPKYMPDCRKSHLIFQNSLGRPPDPPPALGSGLRPFTGPPFQNSWIRPCTLTHWQKHTD